MAVDALRRAGLPAAMELSAQPQWPVLTVHRFGGAMDSFKLVDQARLQLDAWGADRQSAYDLMAEALQVLWELPTNSPLADVLDVTPDLPMAWMPDTSVTPPRPRYIAGVYLTMR